jgi:OOP family OmpA-OmpF porin
MRRNLLLAGILVFGIKTLAFSQENLVPNGSFENTIAIPESVSQFYLARPWSSTAPGLEPADLFHKRAKSMEVASPQNYMGSQEPHTGEVFAGIAILRKGKQDYREFMQVLLTKPLEKGETYEAEFYTSLSDYSELATNSLGLFFSRKAPLLAQNGFMMVRPQIIKSKDEIISETKEWVKVIGRFKAQGGETMLTIGNFMAQDKTPKKKVKSSRKETDKEAFAYYYIDDVSLVKVGGKIEEIVAKKSEYFGEVKTKKPVTLNNIFFRTDEAVLLPTSFPELEKLYEFLVQNPTLTIQINGHTDNTSNPEYNQTLSENRANAVKKYLVQKGISENNIKTQGFGSSKPVASNETEEGKQQNRRVEFEILK